MKLFNAFISKFFACVSNLQILAHWLGMGLLSLMLFGCSMSNENYRVRLTEGIDESAGPVPAYIISTPSATYYLEKHGGGLSSMLDKDGVDWIGFNNIKGSGHKGEYRGFPNAIHKQDGSYFHAMNAGTDTARGEVLIELENHVRIAFTSENGKWVGQWDFYPTHCNFTMTTVSPGYHYWVQYEGVPGGSMDDTDFWYNSATDIRHPINDSFNGDLPSPEWYAFGDESSPRMIFLLNHDDDTHPDNYVSRPYMTVLGFGRHEKNKFLNTPKTFSIGFVESVEYEKVSKEVATVLKQIY
ncbi:hypothetical protein AVL56_12230 [Alteromonas stellipolaris]|uniref:Uncharacterized protein n=3 Tax=Alteromonas TaxID=226 RepID=A0ABN4LVW3_9ALTE|nr:hypothetical protein AVL57_13105 [Alteromonas stellipolaris]AMJ88869.1 hypothetical protein AV939_11945 [Alteromonas sp. Mac1]AMJ92718.1 hypothetical protein AV940_11710 [Alteromonas sp. Mac2]AMJ96582.1 hypothetical protein AVL56_12230 [Alteromonas stellipolaris]ANB23608.1 hypothetical protein A6K25_12710 [Alteromonas stellipolaris]